MPSKSVASHYTNNNMSVETPVPLQVFPAVDAKPEGEELELGKVADDDGPSYTPEEERRGK